MPRNTLRALTGTLTIAISIGAGLIAPMGAHAATSSAQYSARLATLINQARAQQGLGPLQVEPGTSQIAGSWAQHLARTQQLAHNDNLGSQLSSHGSAGWTTAAENVGSGSASDPDGLFQAYMKSPEHRANIVSSSIHYLGIDTEFTGSTSWNVMDFVDRYQGVSATAPQRTRPPVTSRVSAPVVRHPPAPVQRAAARPAVRAVHRLRPGNQVAARNHLVGYEPAASGLQLAAASATRPGTARPALESAALALLVAVALALTVAGRTPRRCTDS